jgi:toxin ParE1/3/4
VTPKPIILRRQANRDIEAAIDYYAGEAGKLAVQGFFDSLEQAYWRLVRYPGAGSARYAHELNLPGLRFLLLKRFPYSLFYVERADHIDVVRVLHAERDISSWLRIRDSEPT